MNNVWLLTFIDSKEFNVIIEMFVKSQLDFYESSIKTKDAEKNIIKYTDHDISREMLTMLESFKNQFIFLATEYMNSPDIDMKQKEMIKNKIESLFK